MTPLLMHLRVGIYARIITMKQNPWQLDPTLFPQRIEIAISEHSLKYLELLSAKTGRPIRDICADIISQAT